MNFSKRLMSAFLVLLVLVSCVSITATAKGDVKYGIGFVTGTNVRVRSKASTSSSSKILASANKNEVAVVISKSGSWYKIIYNQQEGYMHADYLKVAKKENAELGYGVINGTSVNLRKGPATSYAIVAQANTGDKGYIIGINNGWYKLIFNGKICYVRSDFMDLTEIPYENKASKNEPLFFKGGKSTGVAVSAAALKAASEKPATTKNNTTNKKTEVKQETTKDPAQEVIDLAKSCLGIPYKRGGTTTKGFDCSGFVYYVLKTLGYSSNRTAADQYKMGTYVSKKDLKPGDLVFFAGTYKSGISHVGIYLGDGQFIHSPHTGDVVKISDLNSSYYKSHYHGARRVV